MEYVPDSPKYLVVPDDGPIPTPTSSGKPMPPQDVVWTVSMVFTSDSEEEDDSATSPKPGSHEFFPSDRTGTGPHVALPAANINVPTGSTGVLPENEMSTTQVAAGCSSIGTTQVAVPDAITTVPTGSTGVLPEEEKGLSAGASECWQKDLSTTQVAAGCSSIGTTQVAVPDAITTVPTGSTGVFPEEEKGLSAGASECWQKDLSTTQVAAGCSSIETTQVAVPDAITTVPTASTGVLPKEEKGLSAGASECWQKDLSTTQVAAGCSSIGTTQVAVPDAITTVPTGSTGVFPEEEKGLSAGASECWQKDLSTTQVAAGCSSIGTTQVAVPDAITTVPTASTGVLPEEEKGLSAGASECWKKDLSATQVAASAGCSSIGTTQVAVTDAITTVPTGSTGVFPEEEKGLSAGASECWQKDLSTTQVAAGCSSIETTQVAVPDAITTVPTGSTGVLPKEEKWLSAGASECWQKDLSTTQFAAGCSSIGTTQVAVPDAITTVPTGSTGVLPEEEKGLSAGASECWQKDLSNTQVAAGCSSIGTTQVAVPDAITTVPTSSTGVLPEEEKGLSAGASECWLKDLSATQIAASAGCSSIATTQVAVPDAITTVPSGSTGVLPKTENGLSAGASECWLTTTQVAASACCSSSTTAVPATATAISNTHVAVPDAITTVPTGSTGAGPENEKGLSAGASECWLKDLSTTQVTASAVTTQVAVPAAITTVPSVYTSAGASGLAKEFEVSRWLKYH